jgi:hypothetical protein
MMWRKLGLIFCPNGTSSWMVSHAALPFVEKLQDDIFRIYFSVRDSHNSSQGAALDFDLAQRQVITLIEHPVLALGNLGCFDDSAAWPSSIVQDNNKKFLYYIGWNAGKTVSFYSAIGLALYNEETQSFMRCSNAPIMDRTHNEPILATSPFVIKEENVWKMWYVSGVKWTRDNNLLKHYYHIKYAESLDGVQWNRQGHVAIDFLSGDEYALGRPSVLKDGDIYHMWFCYRGGANTYRIGYASSEDGIHWRRDDAFGGVDVSPAGWDSEMTCYPHVFKHNKDVYMLYNGNGYGKTGFGLALLER